MNSVARKGLVTAMVAGGVLASAGYAQADSAADGAAAGSPGVLSGNQVQAPVHIPVNVCGDTINVIGLLNPASGNTCVNAPGSYAPAARSCAHASGPSGASAASSTSRPGRHAGAAADESGLVPGGPRRPAVGGAHAAGAAHGSPGVLSGNSLQLPIDVPVNVSGNSVNVVGVGNPSAGDTSMNVESPQPPAHPPVPAPPNEPPQQRAAAAAPALAHTGADGLGWAAAGSAGLILGGGFLYRRFRADRAA